MTRLHQQDFTDLDLQSPVQHLLTKTPVWCTPEATLEAAFVEMDRHRVGSMIVVNPGNQTPVGILTRYDLLSRVVLPKIPLSAPISEVMSTGLVTIEPETSALEAMLIMARKGIRHLPVVDQGRLVGMVSERDLVAMQRATLGSLSAEIERATQLIDLEIAMPRCRQLTERMLKEGLSATSVARLVSHLNDAITRRVLAIVEELRFPAHAEPCGPWVWLALGSEGREEQTVATDQDNAIVFSAGCEHERDRLMEFAADVNQALDRLGFPLCKGGVMAMNADWCMSATEWREEIQSWIRTPNPEALLKAHTFFDFRPIAGDLGLAHSLRRWMVEAMGANQAFQKILAQDALRQQVRVIPSLTWRTHLARLIRRKGGRAEWLSPSRVDIKKVATAPVVGWARALTIDCRTLAGVSTDERLEALKAHRQVRRGTVQAYRQAFDRIQRYRLQAQLRSPEGGNELLLDDLSSHDLRLLHEATERLSELRQSVEIAFQL